MPAVLLWHIEVPANPKGRAPSRKREPPTCCHSQATARHHKAPTQSGRSTKLAFAFHSWLARYRPAPRPPSRAGLHLATAPWVGLPAPASERSTTADLPLLAFRSCLH